MFPRNQWIDSRWQISATILMAMLTVVAVTAGPAAGQNEPPKDEERNRPLDYEDLEAEGRREMRDAYYHSRRRPAADDPGFDAARARLLAVESQRALQKAGDLQKAFSGSYIQWQNIGPAPTTNGQTPTSDPRHPSDVSGRISALAIAPTAGTVYLGGAQGGIWKSDDLGATWTSITEDLASLAVGSIELDPSDEDTIYFGTGEGNGTCDSYGGIGIYKSIDGGDTWTGPFGGAEFGMNRGVPTIEVDRSNSNVVLAGSASGVAGIGCATGPNFPDRGIFRSTDGGATWTKVTTGNNRISKIMQDPLTDSVFWAAAWFTGNGGGPDGGLLKSIDSGASWTTVGTGGGLPAVDATWGRAWITGTIDGAESVLYLANSVSSGRLWKSIDSGDNWTLMSAANGFCAGQCFYDMPIWVEPGDPDTVYTGGAGTSAAGVIPSQMMRSTNGGTSFTDIVRSTDMSTAMHADVHAITTVPGQDNHVWVGNDGGVWRSTDRGTNWINVNSNLALTQFTRCDLDPSDPDRAYGGTQDNGTMGWTGIPGWPHLDFGDGGFALIDQSTPNNLVHTYFNQQNNLIGVGFTSGGFATTMGFYNFSGAPANGIPISDRVLFYAPIHLDHGDTDRLYFGTHRLYGAGNFFAGGGPFSVLGGGSDLSGGGSAALSAIETHSATPGTPSTLIFTGSSTGTIQRSTNSGASFTPVATLGLFVSDIAIDHSNTSRVYASLAGFSLSPGQNVWRSTNGGTTWSVAGSGLPDIPVNTLYVDPLVTDRIWAGTDIGVYVSENGGDSWEPASDGLPAVAVFEIQARSNGRIIACTHGRSAFGADLTELPLFADGFEVGNTTAWSTTVP